MMLTISKSVLFAMLAAAAKTSLVFAAPLTRIVGGEESSPGDFPYYVEMGDCGGALIASDTVLFAAHCENWKDKQLNIGAYKAASLQGGAQERFCDVWVPDPEFDSITLNYDFALCKLNEPVTIDESSVVLELNEEDSVPGVGEDLIVMGLGAIESGGSYPEFLRDVIVPAVSNSDCNNEISYNGEITDNMICAGFPDIGGKDSCQGDSGGPLVQRIQRDGKFVDLHVGVVSWGYGCAFVNLPGVYARTSKRAEWIKATACQQFKSTASFCENEPPPPSPPTNCGNDLIIKVTTDQYAYETEWTLKDSQNRNVLTRKYLINSYQNEHNICLKANECYKWIIKDFDGFSEGSYSINLNGQEIASGSGNFSGNKNERFCTGESTPTIAPVPSPNEDPVPSPTVAPVPSPTVAPFPAPTVAPVPSPTLIPATDSPTEPSTIWNSQWSSDLGSNDGTDISSDFSTYPPTSYPTDFPTDYPTDFEFCRDSRHFFFNSNVKKTCEWAGKGNVRKIKKKCNKKWRNVRVYDWCPETCGMRAGLGACA